jgi:hypothetical protein
MDHQVQPDLLVQMETQVHLDDLVHQDHQVQSEKA